LPASLLLPLRIFIQKILLHLSDTPPEKVGELREDPLRLVQKLVNSPYYRLRVGDYRVVLDIQRNVLRVLVLKVGHRESVYGR